MPEHELQKEIKSYVCMFLLEGHRTWRVTLGRTVEQIEWQLKTQLGKNKVTKKKFFEIDRLTGSFEEF